MSEPRNNGEKTRSVPEGRRVLGDMVSRVSRSMRHLRQAGRVGHDKVDGEYVWRLS